MSGPHVRLPLAAPGAGAALALVLLFALACAEATGPADSTPPALTITSPVEGTLGLTGTITITADADDPSGIAQVHFFIDGRLISGREVPPFTATLETSDHASGVHRIAAVAFDTRGNRTGYVRVTVTFGGDVALPAGYTQTVVAPALGSRATAIAAASDRRLFVTEQAGAIRVIKDGALLPAPFATVAALVGNERGLLGIALLEEGAVVSHVLVYYTTADGGAHNRISRFTVNGDVAGAAEEILVDLPALSTSENHNGGAMTIGPDGKLYVAVGDNAQGALAPLLSSPFGKILRFEPDGSIPADNPFYLATSGVNRAIWARGLRNPFTIAFEESCGGADDAKRRLHINDVGANLWEEVNLGRRGADYGWPGTEGPTTAVGVDAPILAYRHTASPTLFEGGAIVGAAFARRRPSCPYDPPEHARYYFADHVAGWIYVLDPSDDWRPVAFAHSGGHPTNLAFGADGDLYVTMGARVDRIGQ